MTLHLCALFVHNIHSASFCFKVIFLSCHKSAQQQNAQQIENVQVLDHLVEDENEHGSVQNWASVYSATTRFHKYGRKNFCTR